MCYNPLRIINNSKSGTQYSSFYRTVPCGKCEECLSTYKNEWYIRAYFQYEEYKKEGFTTFITLTYSNDNLPYYKDPEYDFETPCFNKWHIQRFVKYLRRYLIKKLKWSIEQAEQVKYLICSEFGSKYTQRSHYHGLLHFPQDITYKDLVKALNYAWSEKGADGQRHLLGWVSFGKGGYKVNNPSGLKYVCKYTSKDINGYNDVHGLQDYLDKFEGNKEKIKNYLPFHLQSRGYGLYGAQFITDDELIQDKMYDPFVGTVEVTEQLDKYVPIPRYYKLKLLTRKPVNVNNASMGLYCHNDRYYTLLPKLFDFRLRQRYELLVEMFYNRDVVCQKLQTERTEAEGLYIDDLYDYFLQHIGFDKLRLYTIFEKIKDYNSYKPDEQPSISNEIAFFDYAYNIIQQEAAAHDMLFDTVDLTYLGVKPEIKGFSEDREQIITIEPYSIYRGSEAQKEMYKMANIDPFCKDLHGNIIDDKVIQKYWDKATIYELVPWTFYGSQLIFEDFDEEGNDKRQRLVDPLPYVLKTKSYSIPIKELECFKEFNYFADMLSKFETIKRENESINRKEKFLLQKQQKDYFEELFRTNKAFGYQLPKQSNYGQLIRTLLA